MFSKISRYQKLSDVVIEDAKGRSMASKTLRLLPDVRGDFSHTIMGGDRLDALSCKYYRQASKWWRYCDANLDFPSPLALLGTEPVVTTRIPLAYSTTGKVAPPWYLLIQGLSECPGVEAVSIVDEAEPTDKEAKSEEHFKYAVNITYNSMNTNEGSLLRIIAGKGFEAGPPVFLVRAGKKIIIPPNITG